MPDTRAEFDRRLDALLPGLSRAFHEAVADVRSSAQLRALEAAIERGDVEGAFQALRMDRAFWAPLDRQIEEAFRSGAIWQAALIEAQARRQGAGLVVRFDGRHPRAEAWSRNRAAALVTEISEDTRVLVRETVVRGLETMTPPRALARQIVGTTVGNERQGGLLGLTSQQARYVQNMRAELADPATMSGYFDRARRDRRFDRTVARAIREGRALEPAQVDAIARRYADRLLGLRGETIARTEALTALSAGRNEQVAQLIDRGDVPPNAVRLIWQATVGSARTRDSHRMMHGQEVRFGEPFVSPLTGARMLFPGDTSRGAPASETINCRCSVRQRIDFRAVARARGTL